MVHKGYQQALSRRTVAVLMALALLMMSSGVGLIYYTTVAHPAQLRAQVTATVQTILTGDARSTAIVNAQATGTAQAYARTTATAQVQATVQAGGTVTAFQDLYTKATSGTPVLNSSLAAQNRYNWDVYNTTDGGGCAFTGGALHVSIFQQHFYVPCFAHATNFSDFVYQVQMTIIKGDEGGLVFRADDTNSKFYFFRIGHNGFYDLYVSKDTAHNMSIADDSSPAINKAPDQPNLLTVIARGSTISLYINKQFVATANDSSYHAGEIGIFAGDNNSATEVAFNNAQVWNL